MFNKIHFNFMNKLMNRSHKDRKNVIHMLPNKTDYTVLKEICQSPGGSVVYLGRHKPSAALITLKQCSVDMSDEHLALLRWKIFICGQISPHPNLHMVSCAWVDRTAVWLVSPCALFGSCREVLDSSYKLGIPAPAIFSMLDDILCGLDYLHSLRIVHRGISPYHLLITDQGKIQLSGMQFASFLPSTPCGNTIVCEPRLFDLPQTKDCGMSRYWAPELLSQNLLGYGDKSDIYSFGLVATELVTGSLPLFSGTQKAGLDIGSSGDRLAFTLAKMDGSLVEAVDQALSNRPACFPEGYLPSPCTQNPSARQYEQPPGPQLVKLIMSCLGCDELERPAPHQLRRHLKKITSVTRKQSISVVSPTAQPAPVVQTTLSTSSPNFNIPTYINELESPTTATTHAAIAVPIYQCLGLQPIAIAPSTPAPGENNDQYNLLPVFDDDAPNNHDFKSEIPGQNEDDFWDFSSSVQQ